MAERISQEELARIATITDAPARTKVDRTFGLPTGLYVATVAAYLGFLAVMAMATMNPGLVLPMVIFAVFIAAGFGVPSIWARMQPATPSRAIAWSEFRRRGVETLTGRLTAGEATVQVLILPVLILAWGVITATIIALT